MSNKSALLKFINLGLLLSQFGGVNSIDMPSEDIPSEEMQANDPYLADLIQNLEYLKNNTNLEPQSPRDSRMFEPPTSLKLGSVEEGKHYARLAGASYCSAKNLKAWSCTHCKYVKAQYIDTYYDKDTEALALLAKDDDKKEIVLSFRGSSTLKNFIEDAKFVKKALTLGEDKLWVHLGFKRCSDALIPKYLPTLKKLLDENKGYKLAITGHSLGGAVSVVSALLIRDQLKLSDDLIKVYTYGEPRVGDKEFAQYMNRQSFLLTRIVNNNDIVPHLPPQVNNISNYYHHHHEIWLNKGKETICGEEYLEDPNCSLSKWLTTSIFDHLKAWDIRLGLFC